VNCNLTSLIVGLMFTNLSRRHSALSVLSCCQVATVGSLWVLLQDEMATTQQWRFAYKLDEVTTIRFRVTVSSFQCFFL